MNYKLFTEIYHFRMTLTVKFCGFMGVFYICHQLTNIYLKKEKAENGLVIHLERCYNTCANISALLPQLKI